MARQDRFIDGYRALLAPSQEPETESSRVNRVVSDFVRAIGERAVPLSALGVRLASGALSFPGQGFGAAMSGAGETLAQMIEGRSTDLSKIKKGRVAVEAGIGAIPFAKTISAGKALMSALKGGTIATAGTVGRKVADAASEGSTEPLKEWSAWDALPTVLGSGISGVAGKYTPTTAKPAPKDYEIVPTAQPGGQIINPEGKGVITSTGVPPIRSSGEPLPSVQSRPPAKVEADTVPIIGAYGVSDKQARKTAQEWQQEARNLNAEEKYLKGVAKETDREALLIEQQRNRDWLQEAKNLNAHDAYERARRNARAVARRLRQLKAQGATASTTISQTSKTQTPGSDVTARTVIRAAGEEGGAGSGGSRPASPRPTSLESKGIRVMDRERAAVVLGYDPEEAVRRGVAVKDGDGYRLNTEIFKKTRARTEAGGRVPEKPVGPKPGVFQIVTPEGKVSDVTDEASAEELLNLLGPKAKVILPSDYVPKPPKPPDEPPAAAAAPIAPKPPAPPAPAAAAVEPASPPRTAPGPLSAQTRLAELGYTPDDIQKLTAKEADAIIKAGTKKEAFAPLTPKAPKGPAVPIADVSEVLAEGPFARFFPNQKEALKAGALVEEQPEDLIGKIWQLFGKADTTKRLAKAEGKEDASGSLWQMISKLSKEHNLPSLPRGASAKPNFKNVPPAERGMKPTLSTKPLPGQQSLGAPPAAPQFREPISSPVWMGDPADPQKHQKILDNLLNQKNRIINSNIIYEVAPDDIKIRMQAAGNKLEILNNAGKVPSKEADQVSQELQKLSEAAFERQYPHLVSEIAETEKRVADAAAKAQAVPKEPKGKAEPPKISANPFFDPEAYKWAGQALGPEGIGALVGGGIGAVTSEDDPFGGAALGGVAGYLGGRGLRSLKNTQYPNPEQKGLSPWDRIVNFQRFALLANPENLAVNFAAPTTGSALSAIERMLAGLGERAGLSPVTENLDLGKRGLTAVLNPSRALKLNQDRLDAIKLISEAERSDLAQRGVAPTTWDKFIRMPADVLTTGDIGARKALMAAGWTEDMARLATVTSEPRYRWLGKWIANIGREGAGRFLLPFSRTAANVLEGSLERTPILGVFMHMTQDNPALQQSVAEIAAQQGMGGLVSTAAYLLGANIDPETAREAKWPLYITNLSGQYGALAAAAFAMGQASQYDDSTGNLIRAAGGTFSGDVPLPTTDPVTGIIRTAAAYSQGEPVDPNAESLPQRWLPPMLTPRFMRDDVIERVDSFADDYRSALGL